MFKVVYHSGLIMSFLVNIRETGELQVLSASHQSGGVSILYLELNLPG